jgi:hypothetical protein
VIKTKPTTNEEVIRAFLRGNYGRSHTDNLRTNGEVLVNYNTVIAQHEGTDTIILNTAKYSKTTSGIQSRVRFMAQQGGFKVTEMAGEPVRNIYNV